MRALCSLTAAASLLLSACFEPEPPVGIEGDPPDTGTDGSSAPTDSGCTDVCYDLGNAQPYNVFARYDYVGAHTDIEGKAAAGQTFEMDGFSVCLLDPGANCVVGRQGLTLNNGQLYGDAHYEYGTATVGADVNFYNGGGASQARTLDWPPTWSDLQATNASLAALTPSSTATAGGDILFSGSDPALNVFEVTPTALASAHFMSVTAPAGSTVIINVTGTAATFSGFAIHLNGVSSSEVLWNFRYARTIELEGIGFEGSILAPYADLTFNNGQMNGKAAVRNAWGNGQYNLSLFEGEACECVP
jgi:choice-of-anchor A domain-containing protein